MRSAASTEFEGVATRAIARWLVFAAAGIVLLAAGLLTFDAASGARLAAILSSTAAGLMFALCLYFPRLAATRAASLLGSTRGFDPDLFLENSDEAAFIVDPTGSIKSGNAHLAALLGIDPLRVARGDLADVLPGPLLEAIATMFDLGLDSTGVLEFENLAGEWMIVEVRRHKVRIDGKPAFALAMRDFTEARKREIELATLAFQDQLTGLANRAALQRRMARLRDDLAEGPEASYGVMVLDLDGFKQVNDKLGHSAGDEVLTEVGKRIAATTPRNAFVSRNGGDEFVIVVGPRANFASMRQIAAGIVDVVAAPIALGIGPAEVGVSIGIALAPADGDDPTTLIEAADAAMYRAKRSRMGYAFVSDPIEAPARSVA